MWAWKVTYPVVATVALVCPVEILPLRGCGVEEMAGAGHSANTWPPPASPAPRAENVLSGPQAGVPEKGLCAEVGREEKQGLKDTETPAMHLPLLPD